MNGIGCLSIIGLLLCAENADSQIVSADSAFADALNQIICDHHNGYRTIVDESKAEYNSKVNLPGYDPVTLTYSVTDGAYLFENRIQTLGDPVEGWTKYRELVAKIKATRFNCFPMTLKWDEGAGKTKESGFLFYTIWKSRPYKSRQGDFKVCMELVVECSESRMTSSVCVRTKEVKVN